MKIFLSWSGNRSKEIALLLKKFLEGLFRNDVNVWMSHESITYGSMSIQEIHTALINSDKCIALITEDNISSPWIMYEAGTIMGQNSANTVKANNRDIIIPILFDDISDLKFVGNPLNQFQRLQYNRKTMLRLVKQFNGATRSFTEDDILEKQFSLNWSALNKEIKAILNKFSLSRNAPLSCKYLMEALENAGF